MLMHMYVYVLIHVYMCVDTYICAHVLRSSASDDAAGGCDVAGAVANVVSVGVASDEIGVVLSCASAASVSTGVLSNQHR